MPNTFAPVIDELNRTVAAWEPVNGNDEAAFQAVRVMLGHLPELLDEVANGCRTLAGKAQDQILFKSGAGDLLDETANYVRAAVDPLRQVAAGVDHIHRDDVDRLQQTDPRVAAMDWKPNQDC